jgi:hypothetical protein
MLNAVRFAFRVEALDGERTRVYLLVRNLNTR